MEDEALQPPGTGVPAREHTGGVIGVGIGLLLVLGLLAQLAIQRGGDVDATRLLAELMPAGAPPGFEVVAAVTLPTGETLLRLEATDEASAGPEELVLVRYRSNKEAEADMRGARTQPGERPGPGRGGSDGKEQEDPGQMLERWEREQNFATHLTVEKGELAWDAWRAARATERSLRADGTWRESVRVNLSQPERFLLLFAQWPPERYAEPDELKPILRCVAMAPAGV